ncbi:MAG: FumA C-terminus/TtdB family hydratase beta subunit [Lentisphaeria bacterium]
MPRILQLPLRPEEIRSLQLNEQVELNGTIFTARDAAHKFLSKASLADLPNGLNLHQTVFYHCGPVVIREHGEWKITAAGPTTSIREETYMAKLIEKFSLQAVIGKGGMGEQTAQACKRFGCVYLHAVGGAAQVLAKAVKKVPAVYFLEEFGFPEAVWCLEVEHFPAVVTINAQGNSLHLKVQEDSQRVLQQLLAKQAL